MILPVLLFIAGSAILYLGAEGLVRGAMYAAASLGIRPIVVGATVVAIGTSMPEFLVSLVSVLAGSSDIAFGNVVGSNIANIGLILGIGAVLRPVAVDGPSLRFYYPVVLASSAVLFGFALPGSIGFVQGFTLLCGIGVFIFFLVRQPSVPYQQPAESAAPFRLRYILYMLAGVGLLIVGSKLMVDSGIAVARMLGVPELAIGVSMVAVGTSLPELATTVVAFFRKSSEILLGNILGSNIFNILFVVGGVAVVRPIAVPASTWTFELPVMMAFTLALYVVMRSGFTVSRREGIVLLIGYAVFIGLLF
jgi:cation:H+ antiporter